MGVFTVTFLEKDGSAGRIFFLGLTISYAYCNRSHYASPTFMCYCLLEIFAFYQFVGYFINIFWKIREHFTDYTIKHNYFCLI